MALDSETDRFWPRLCQPVGLAVASHGDIFVADCGNLGVSVMPWVVWWFGFGFKPVPVLVEVHGRPSLTTKRTNPNHQTKRETESCSISYPPSGMGAKP